MLTLLKPFTYLSPIEVADWLKFDPSMINATGDTKASGLVGDVTFTANRVYGTDGNSIKISFVSSTIPFEFESQVQLKIGITSGVTTAQQIVDRCKACEAIANMVTASTVLGSNVQTTQAYVTLTGGANAAKYDARLYRTITALNNASCDKISSLIHGPVLTRSFTEIHDGNNSNVIVPEHWPVRTIQEVRIDYNRQFGTETVLPAYDYFLRGGSDVRQVEGDVSLEIVGSNIVLRDDNEKFIIGRVFSGSTLGSIRIKYTAGWGTTPDDLPSDLTLATLQLLEFHYMQRENRDIGLSSKGVKGESYSKIVDGVPAIVLDAISVYTDLGFGSHSVPQRNYMRV